MLCARTGVGHYVCFFWQPSYYSEVYGESLQDASLLSIVPFAAAAVSTNVAGWVADALVSRNCMGLTCIRKTMQVLVLRLGSSRLANFRNDFVTSSISGSQGSLLICVQAIASFGPAVCLLMLSFRLQVGMTLVHKHVSLQGLSYVPPENFTVIYGCRGIMDSMLWACLLPLCSCLDAMRPGLDRSIWTSMPAMLQ